MIPEENSVSELGFFIVNLCAMEEWLTFSYYQLNEQVELCHGKVCLSVKRQR